MPTDESKSRKRHRGGFAAPLPEKDDDAKKQRGRPRVEGQDETAADRRRTQIRLAQRAYRQRKETTITTLRDQVRHLQATIDQMNHAFVTFNDRAVSSGVLHTRPELARDLKITTEAFIHLAQASLDGGVDIDSGGLVGHDFEPSDELMQRLSVRQAPEMQSPGSGSGASSAGGPRFLPQRGVPHPLDSVDIGLGYHIYEDDDVAGVVDGVDDGDEDDHVVASSMGIAGLSPSDFVGPTSAGFPGAKAHQQKKKNTKKTPSTSNTIASLNKQLAAFSNSTTSTISKSANGKSRADSKPAALARAFSPSTASSSNVDGILTSSKPSPSKKSTKRTAAAAIPSAVVADPPIPFLPVLFNPPPSPSTIYTLSREESSFARRLQRAALERGFHLLTTASKRPAAFQRAFRLSLQYNSPTALMQKFRALLTNTSTQPLEFFHTPFIHLGGAGLHYAKGGVPNGFIVKPGPVMTRRAEWEMQSAVAADSPQFQQKQQLQVIRAVAPTEEGSGPQPASSGKSIHLFSSVSATAPASPDADFYVLDHISPEELAADYAGTWFDSNDVEGWLKEMGVSLRPGAGFADVRVAPGQDLWRVLGKGSGLARGVKRRAEGDADDAGARRSTSPPQDVVMTDSEFDVLQDLGAFSAPTMAYHMATTAATTDPWWSSSGASPFPDEEYYSTSADNSPPASGWLGEHDPDFFCSGWMGDPSRTCPWTGGPPAYPVSGGDALVESPEAMGVGEEMRVGMEDEMDSAAAGGGRGAARKCVRIDVAKMIDELIRTGICLGRAPGFRKTDVERALSSAVIQVL